MMAMTARERRILVRLLRDLSPRNLEVIPPVLRPDLEALTSARLPHRPRAILFDVYGTLLVSAAGGEPNTDNEHDGRQGEKALAMLERELRWAGYEGGSARFACSLAGLIDVDREKRISHTLYPEVDIVELASRLMPGSPPSTVRSAALLLEASSNPCAPMPGALGLLKRLRASGVRLGLVSNAQFYTPLLIEALMGRSLEKLGFESCLQAFSFEGGVAKPDVAPYLSATNSLLASGMTAGEILVIGNSSINDIAPAQRLGFMTVLFAGDVRSFRPAAPGEPGAQPDSLLRSFDSFEDLLPAAP